jgi:hypothetical protein
MSDVSTSDTDEDVPDEELEDDTDTGAEDAPDTESNA